MNFAQSVDPYKVWNRFPAFIPRPNTYAYRKVRTEVIDIIRACPGSYSKELRLKTGRKKRAMFALLQSLRKDGVIERIGQRYFPK